MDEQPVKKKKNWFWRIFTFLFCAAVIFAIIFSVMANIGGNSEPLRQSIEQYLNQSTPYQARVGKLNNMHFFPTIIIDFEDLQMRSKVASTAEPAITAEKVFMAASFWDVTTHSGKVSAIYLKNINAAPDTILKQPLYIKDISILTNQDANEAILKAEGTIGQKPFLTTTNLEVFGKLPQQYYRLPPQKNIQINFGEFSLKTESTDIPGAGINLQNLDIKKDKTILGGYLMLRPKEDFLAVIGGVTLPEFGTSPKPDLKIKFEEKGITVTGMMEMPGLKTEDFAPNSRFNDFVKTMSESFALPNGKTVTWDVDLEMEDGKHMKLTLKDGIFVIQ